MGFPNRDPRFKVSFVILGRRKNPEQIALGMHKKSRTEARYVAIIACESQKSKFSEAGGGIEPPRRCFADTHVSSSSSGRDRAYFILLSFTIQNFFVTLHPRMRKLRVILLVILGIGFIVGLVLFFIGYPKPKKASINIETTPSSLVYINGQQVGRTPYRSSVSPGEVIVKLVPEERDVVLAPFETKVNLISGIETVIRREFGETEDASFGEIISFEKIGGKEASLAVVSVPNNAQVSIDGVKKGFAPVKNTVTPGEHQIIVSAPGSSERVLSIQTLIGYKLTAVVKLASTPESRKEEAPKEEKQTLVEILPTDTGFLRVREKPGPAGAEVAQVKPGQRFLFLEEDAETGWYKIEYETGKEGWVSNTYSKKIEGVLSSPSP